MKILQFSFSRGAESYLPHRHPVRAVVYLGTHDNDTTRGWFTELEKGASLDNPEAAARKFELERATAYSGIESSEDATQRLMRSLMASPAETAIVTMQDLLNQDSRARMNVPGIGTGNWTYRMPSGALTVELARELRRLTDATERLA
jgi:4-alpha-glucanotransferase